jgi:hypothetical protein
VVRRPSITPAERSRLLREMEIPLPNPISSHSAPKPHIIPNWDEIFPPQASRRDRPITSLNVHYKRKEDSLEDRSGELGTHLEEAALAARDGDAVISCLPPPPFLEYSPPETWERVAHTLTGAKGFGCCPSVPTQTVRSNFTARMTRKVLHFLLNNINVNYD